MNDELKNEVSTETSLAIEPVETAIAENIPETLSAETLEELKLILEGVLFASDKALTVKQLHALFPEMEAPAISTIKELLTQLAQDYANRGVRLVEVASGYCFRVAAVAAPYISELSEEKAPRYSRALLETLAIIAYRQPITRGEIEYIRGVAVSSNILKTIQERDWTRVVGHKDVPGKPALYATTKTFLDYFNLKNLSDLPALSTLLETQEQQDEANLVAEGKLVEDMLIAEEMLNLPAEEVVALLEADEESAEENLVAEAKLEEDMLIAEEMLNTTPAEDAKVDFA